MKAYSLNFSKFSLNISLVCTILLTVTVLCQSPQISVLKWRKLHLACPYSRSSGMTNLETVSLQGFLTKTCRTLVYYSSISFGSIWAVTRVFDSLVYDFSTKFTLVLCSSYRNTIITILIM